MKLVTYYQLIYINKKIISYNIKNIFKKYIYILFDTFDFFT